jgi:hypothetical protein
MRVRIAAAQLYASTLFVMMVFGSTPLLAQVTRETAELPPAFSLELQAAKSKDGQLTLDLLFAPPPSASLASYRLLITYDSTMIRSAEVKTSGGMQIANTVNRGSVLIAGIETGGFAAGKLASIAFDVVDRNAVGTFDILLIEATDRDGRNIVPSLSAASYPAHSVTHTPGAMPHIDSISPAQGSIVRDEILEVVLYGKNFAPTRNTIHMSGGIAAVVPSEANGTRIRFIAPLYVRDRKMNTEIPVHAGPSQVQVENVSGSSNVVNFVVRSGS